MVSRLVIVVHVLKIQDASRPVRFGRVNTHLGASSCHQHGERVPPCRRELRRRPVVQVHITILVVRSAAIWGLGGLPDRGGSGGLAPRVSSAAGEIFAGPHLIYIQNA